MSTKKRNSTRKLVIYQDKISGTIFLRPCNWINGKFKLKPAYLGKEFTKFSAFDSELGKQVKKYLKRCN